MTRKSAVVLAVTAGVLGLVVGAVARGLLPPFVLDEPFWRQFWSGPPAAGLFALAGAGVAYLAAYISARNARRGAERQEWWDRAEWALNLARSDRESDRVIGLRTLQALSDQATTTELQMVLAVSEAVVGDESGSPSVDKPNHVEETWGRRWLRWLFRRSG